MQSNKRIITVIGATGNQGGSVVNAILKDGTMAVRAITRNPNGSDAKDLTKRGVEVCQCDATGPIEGVVKCMKGSYGAFLMTDSKEPNQQGRELEFGKKLVDAARQAGVKHIIWSTLPNVNRLSNGKYNLPSFSDKAEVEEYIRQLQRQTPAAFEHVTFVCPSFFYENFDGWMGPKKEGDTWVFNLPRCSHLVAFDVNEIGGSVLTALKNPTQWEMKRIDFYGEMAPLEQFVRTYEKFTGRKARLNDLSTDEFSKLDTPGAGFLAEMFGWFNEFGYYGPLGPKGSGGDPKSGQDATPGGLSNYETYLRSKAQVSS
jgi:uncharacterized protein YbjT (DUF2867 family)